MGWSTEAIMLAISIGTTAASSYNTYEQGKRADKLALYNAKQQEWQAQMELRSGMAAARLQQQTAEANAALAASEAAARANNANVLEENVGIQDKVQRNNLRQRRQEMEAAAEEQRSQIAASGVLETSGTPLDLLAETAALIQRDQEEQQWGYENERRGLLNEAAQERFGGKLALAGALVQKRSDVGAANIAGATARSRYLGGLREAQMTRLLGKHKRQEATGQAVGSFLSGASGAYGNYAG